MFNNPFFDTAIALITLYLLFSQLTLSLVELPAGALNTRGAYLHNRLKEVLGPTIHGKFYASSTIQSLCLPKEEKSWGLRAWIALWPAYISETLFAQTIIECVVNLNLTPSTATTQLGQFKDGLTAWIIVTGPTPTSDATFKGTLQTLYDNAISVGSTPEEQSAALQQNLAHWFHDFGERLTGRYKRDNRKYLFWMGLLVALLADVDTVRLAHFLADSNNAKARLALVDMGVKALQEARPSGLDYTLGNTAQAAQYRKQNQEWSVLLKTADASLKSTLAAVPQVGLPLGLLRWTSYGKPNTVRSDTTQLYRWTATADDYGIPAYAQRHVLNAQTGKVTDAPSWHWVHMVAGWLLTAFALMIGAPFWFDTLCRFVNIRNVGIKPAPAN